MSKYQFDYLLGRSPYGERGLKSVRYGDVGHVQVVAPHTGSVG